MGGLVIGVGFRVEVKKSRILTDGQRRLAIPMVELTQLLASRILDRIRRGQGPRGPWSVYASGGEARDESYFWVAPGRPQPGDPEAKDGLVFRVESGEWKGWAAYQSVAAYYRLRGLTGQPHDFDESGRLLQSAAVRIVTARQTRLAFYGGHGKLSAKQVAWFSSRNEADPLLMPSASEVQEAQAFIAERINADIIEGARLGEVAQRLTSSSRSVNRRASKLLGD